MPDRQHSRSSCLAYREGDQCIRRTAAELSSAASRDHDILFPVAGLIGHWCCVAAAIDLGGPKLTAGARIESAEAMVVGRRNKYQAAGGGNSAANVGCSGI